MAGGHLLSRRRIVHILDAEFAQDEAPICLGFGIEVRDDGLIDACGLVELTGAAQTIGSLKELELLLVVRRRHSLAGAAIFTNHDPAFQRAGNGGPAGGAFDIQ